MSESLERLKEIGAQKIYDDTHIPVGHIESILYENFKSLSKLQFLGFISIIEREYGYDLSELRDKGLAYFNELDANKNVVINESIYKAPANKKSFMFVYIAFAVIIFVTVMVYTMGSSEENSNALALENKVIKEVKQNLFIDKNESNSSDNMQLQDEKMLQEDDNISAQLDVNSSENVNEEELQEEPPAIIEHKLEIIAKKRVWLGYIDVTENKRYQKTFKGSLKLDPSKAWLLYFGHGNVEITVDNEIKKFHDRSTLRLYYKDGEIRKVSLQEFKRLNRGRKW